MDQDRAGPFNLRAGNNKLVYCTIMIDLKLSGNPHPDNVSHQMALGILR
jgi:hypothetical protein